MAPVPFVIERKVHYHGTWNIGFHLTDEFTKNIAHEYKKHPPCPSFITLSSSAFSLVAFTKDGSRELHRNKIEFDSLREIAVNAYNQHCLMILFINSRNKYSLIVCSCQDGKETVNISLAFKQLRNIKTLKEHESTLQKNWTLRKNSLEQRTHESHLVQNGVDDTLVNGQNGDPVKPRTVSGVVNETFAFLNREDSVSGFDDDVFGDVEREPISNDNSEIIAYHVALQATVYDKNLTREDSFVSLRSFRSEMTPFEIENGHDADVMAPPSEVSLEDFYKSTQVNGQVNGIHSDENGNEEEENGVDALSQKLVSVTVEEDYEYRSVGTQTNNLIGGSKRYKKRPGSMGSSNSYKQQAEQRKLISTSSSSLQTTPSPSPAPSITDSVVMRSRPANKRFDDRGGIRYQSLVLPRQIQVSSTSVARPIENVYKTFSKGTRNRTINNNSNSRRRPRRIIYVQPDPTGVPAK